MPSNHDPTIIHKMEEQTWKEVVSLSLGYPTGRGAGFAIPFFSNLAVYDLCTDL